MKTPQKSYEGLLKEVDIAWTHGANVNLTCNGLGYIAFTNSPGTTPFILPLSQRGTTWRLTPDLFTTLGLAHASTIDTTRRSAPLAHLSKTRQTNTSRRSNASSTPTPAREPYAHLELTAA